MSRKTNKKKHAPKGQSKKRDTHHASRVTRRRLPFPLALARRLGYKCRDMAAADMVLHRFRPRLRGTFAGYYKKYPAIKDSFDRGLLLALLADAARGIQTVSQAARQIGFDSGRELRELLDSDIEVNSVWTQSRIKTAARAKKALVKAAEDGNQAAIRAVEHLLAEEGEGRPSGNVNIKNMGISETADLFGVTRQTVHQWYTKYGMPRNADGSVNIQDAVRWYEGFVKAKSLDSAAAASTPDALRDLKAEQMKLNIAHRKAELLDRAEVVAGLAGRWQKITAAFRYRGRELASLVHNQSIDAAAKIIENFFAELQESWLEVPEFLLLDEKAGKMFVEFMEAIKQDGN